MSEFMPQREGSVPHVAILTNLSLSLRLNPLNPGRWTTCLTQAEDETLPQLSCSQHLSGLLSLFFQVVNVFITVDKLTNLL